MGPIRNRNGQGPIRRSRYRIGPIRKVQGPTRKSINTKVSPHLSEITPRNEKITIQRGFSSEAAGSSSVPEYQPQNDEPPQLQNSILEQVGYSPDALPSLRDEATMHSSNNQTGEAQNQAEGNAEAVDEAAISCQERFQKSVQVVAGIKLMATDLVHAHSKLDSLGYSEINEQLMYMLYYQVNSLDTIVEFQLQVPFFPGHIQMPPASEVTDVPQNVTGNENEEAVDEQVTTSQDPLSRMSEALLVFDDMKVLCSNLCNAYSYLESLGFSDFNPLGMKLFFHQLNSVAMIVETVFQINQLAKQMPMTSCGCDQCK